jgi:hypothetical protein
VTAVAVTARAVTATANSYLTAVDAPATAATGEPSAVPGAAPGTGDERMLGVT